MGISNMTKLIQCSSWINYWREAIVAPSTDVTRPFWVVNREKALPIEFLIYRGNTYDWLTTNPSQQVAVLTFDLPTAQPPPTTKPDNTTSRHSCTVEAPRRLVAVLAKISPIGNIAMHKPTSRGSHAGNLSLFCTFFLNLQSDSERARWNI